MAPKSRHLHDFSTTMTDLSAETAQRSALRADGAPAHLTQGGGALRSGHQQATLKSRSLFSFFLSRPFPSLAPPNIQVRSKRRKRRSLPARRDHGRPRHRHCRGRCRCPMAGCRQRQSPSPQLLLVLPSLLLLPLSPPPLPPLPPPSPMAFFRFRSVLFPLRPRHSGDS